MTTKVFGTVFALLLGLSAYLQVAQASPETGETISPKTVTFEWVLEYPVTIETQELAHEPVMVSALREHTVTSGETLSQIAETYLGSAESYPQIALTSGIDDPDLIFPGQVLQIEVTTLSEPEFVTRTHVEIRQERINVTLPVMEETSQDFSASTDQSAMNQLASIEDGKTQLLKVIEKLVFASNAKNQPKSSAVVCGPSLPLCDPIETTPLLLTPQITSSNEEAVLSAQAETLVIEPSRPPEETWQWPVVAPLSDYFGVCNLELRPTCHTGIDIDLYSFSARGEHAQIRAARSGIVTVSQCSSSDGYGCRVEIDHGDGTSSMYAHLSQINYGLGNYLDQGEVLGYSGITGFSTGEHLHFEIKINGQPQNPLTYLP